MASRGHNEAKDSVDNRHPEVHQSVLSSAQYVVCDLFNMLVTVKSSWFTDDLAPKHHFDWKYMHGDFY